MSLLDEAHYLAKRRNPTGCTVGVILDQYDGVTDCGGDPCPAEEPHGDVAVEVAALLDSHASGVSFSVMEEILAAHGIDLSSSTISRHQRGKCKCLS